MQYFVNSSQPSPKNGFIYKKTSEKVSELDVFSSCFSSVDLAALKYVLQCVNCSP